MFIHKKILGFMAVFCMYGNLGLAQAAPINTILPQAQPFFHLLGPASIKNSGLWGTGPGKGLSPQDILQHYQINNQNQGAGQTIAIVNAFDDPSIEADLAIFNTQFNLPACTTFNGCFKKTYVGNTKPPLAPTGASWTNEVALDVEWAHAIAPKAKILLVEAQSTGFADMMPAVSLAASQASVVSMSWGGTEWATENYYDSIFQQTGVSFIAAAGDSGHTRMYPAASPYVVSVGGTSIPCRNCTESAWSNTGGGASLYEPMPASQTNLGIARYNNSMRAIPDVAYNADPNAAPFSIYDSQSGGWLLIGGTSAGAPQWAALMAIRNSERNTALLPNISAAQAYVYKVAAPSSNIIYKYIRYTTIDQILFEDIKIGIDGTCGIECKAGKGYDELTGLGVPVFFK